jgi:hypothetical protein
MKIAKIVLMAIIMFGIFTTTAFTQWNSKMHFPQLPDTLGWDVNATWPKVLADDWQCSETGYVKDLHFWGSWLHGIHGRIDSFLLSIHWDVAINEQNPFSHPGELLWQRRILGDSVIATPLDPMYTDSLSEGWYDPNTGQVLENDHRQYFRYDINLPPNWWFKQNVGTIYWLNISAFVHQDSMSQDTLKWGWKSSDDHWNDDAVWGDEPDPNWIRLYEPVPGGFPYIPGDVNYNGFVNARDLEYLFSWLYQAGPPPPYYVPGTQPPFYPAADVNGDCQVDLTDITYLNDYLHGGLPLMFCPPYPPQGPLQTLDLSFVITGDSIPPDTGGIGGIKFWDLDEDGVYDPGEPGIGGWTIYATDGYSTWSTTTASDGSYEFWPLLVGTYVVSEDNRATYFQTCPASGIYTVLVTANTSAAGIDFGNAGGHINQQHYLNTTNLYAYDFTKVLSGNWIIAAAIHIPFPYHTVWYDASTNRTYIHWYGTTVAPGAIAYACFTTSLKLRAPIISSFWSDIFGLKISDAGPVITINAIRTNTGNINIRLRHNWRAWNGQGWPPQPGDGPGDPFGPIIGSNVSYAITDWARSMEQLTDSILIDPTLQWIPLNEFNLSYGDSIIYSMPDLPDDAIILFKVDLSSNLGYFARDVKEFPVRFVGREGGCIYLPGDINGNGAANGIDVTYGVGYLKGGNLPLPWM